MSYSTPKTHKLKKPIFIKLDAVCNPLKTPVGKKYFDSFFFFVFTLLVLAIYSAAFNLFDNSNCQRYNHTEKLNGGTKEIGNKMFVINICGAGVNNSLFNGDGMERVRLTIFDDQGELLVRRYFNVFWDGQPGHEPLKVSENSIIYQDDKEQKDHAITMPPTRLELIRARLPF